VNVNRALFTILSLISLVLLYPSRILAQTPISCGEIISGTISTVGETDIYTLTVNAGDVMTMRTVVTSGSLYTRMALYDSAGSQIAANTGDTLNYTFNAGGTYTLWVSDYINSNTGSYTLKYQKNNNICPEVVVTAPNGGEILETGEILAITWMPASSLGIATQDIIFSTDGGQTFPRQITTGLSGSVQSYNWQIPPDAAGAKCRVRVVVTDTAGASTPDDSNSDFVILQSFMEGSVTYVYDTLNRLIKVIYGDGRNITYTYDAAGNMTIQDVK